MPERGLNRWYAVENDRIERSAGADRGRDDDSGRPSLRTGQANFWHPALQLVVTSKKIGKPPHAPVLTRLRGFAAQKIIFVT